MGFLDNGSANAKPAVMKPVVAVVGGCKHDVVVNLIPRVGQQRADIPQLVVAKYDPRGPASGNRSAIRIELADSSLDVNACHMMLFLISDLDIIERTQPDGYLYSLGRVSTFLSLGYIIYTTYI